MYDSVFDFWMQNIDNLMHQLWQTLFLFSVSLSISIIVGLAIAIYVTRPGREKARTFALSITGVGQAVPSIAVLALTFLFLGIGARTAIFALVVYSLVPIVFNAASGLISVPAQIKEAARGMGMTDRQILWKVEIPMSFPAIAAGIRSAATINIGTTAVASAIGAGGFGETIFIGLRLMSSEMILGGAIPLALLAIIVDILLSILEKKLTSPGLQLNKSTE
ncbi:ABC-type proline/glycine betaine transport system, permease component [Fervidobacterium pennivorans DSM 9078]|uniref:ABC-type proline/glycine betaine transport system, permease component n=1 Tax=Fervidobacterium pennivorans (strain DSM 9078 / Ven5) TaxID=771875 RepID=H9UCH1_FERPD|nr:ABC transporter permease [Fervidobacterium pennivorans]AFG35214.1 ABC-type proline/glycine betaine transport system, permease component [Fervidobacterium pennivorans DSM 9078]